MITSSPNRPLSQACAARMWLASAYEFRAKLDRSRTLRRELCALGHLDHGCRPPQALGAAVRPRRSTSRCGPPVAPGTSGRPGWRPATWSDSLLRPPPPHRHLQTERDRVGQGIDRREAGSAVAVNSQPATLVGRPASRAANRAMFPMASPEAFTVPAITSSTWSSARPAPLNPRRGSPAPPGRPPWVPAAHPPNRPMGVRTAATTRARRRTVKVCPPPVRQR